MRKLFLSAVLTASFSLPMAAAIDSFPIGTTWPDTDGVHINCHGGCVVVHDGEFYWFGESRTGGHSDGISVYKSKDLYNWENLGYAVTHQGERDDENLQDISEGRLLERPKVIYNAKTGKWVMWAHWENGKDYGEARVAILQSDNITGPYSFVKTMRPNGHDSRDQTLFLDTDGNAYHLCSTNMNQDINLVRLSDDFLDVTPTEQYIMKGARLEASTVCKAGDTYFATFSECKGWDPAPGHTATAVGDMMGTWTEGLNFCVDEGESTSYRSQGAFVFSVGSLGYDEKCFIFYGDRWNSKNVGGSTYVWLPMSVRSGYPTIRNYSTWKLDDVMKSMYRFKRAARITSGNTYSLLERSSNRLLSKIGRFSGFNITDNDDKALSIVFEATESPYVWLLRDADSGRYLAAEEGKLRETTDKDSKSALWTFVLQADGYYKVYNEASSMCLSTAANGRHEGTLIELSVMRDDDSQKFGVYFDSDAFGYEEADMFSENYFKEVAEEVKKQNFKISPSSDKSFVEETPLTVEQLVSHYVLTFIGPDNDISRRRPAVSSNLRNANQTITFRKAPEGAAGKYNVVDGNGYYLYKTKEDGWTGNWASAEELSELEISLSDKEACFEVDRDDAGYHIRSVSTRGWLGTDEYTENATVWLNKGEGLHTVFTFTDPTHSVVVTDRERFLDFLDEVDIVLGGIKEEMIGDKPFDYSREAYDRLLNAFEHALSVEGNYAEELNTLKSELELFESSKCVAPSADCSYYIIHDSGRYLGLSESAEPVIAGDAEESADRFRILPDAESGGYKIMHKTKRLYLAKSTANAWSMEWRDDFNGNRALWTVEWTLLGMKALRNQQSGKYLGSDARTEDSPLYGDKSMSEVNAQWRIVLADTDAVEGIEEECPQIMAVAGGIRICGGNCDAVVYTTLGMKVAEGHGDNIDIRLPGGIYAVKANTQKGSASQLVVVGD